MRRIRNLLTFILAESALETVPEQLWKHPSVSKYAKIRRTKPRYVLLDRSFHHAAMKSLDQNEKRGRPDIVHFALLEALGSPLNKEGLLQTYVHTISDYVIAVNPETRLPRNYDRFVSLIQQLFERGRVPPEQTETALLTLEQKTMPQLIQSIMPSHVLAFSRVGKPRTLEETVSKLAHEMNPLVIVGGFPRGHFSEATMKLVDETVCIDPEMLEAWTVTSRVIYEFERALGFPEKRLKRC
jgi:rRNA small subunit pseudouridine methyltransferase Nep1